MEIQYVWESSVNDAHLDLRWKVLRIGKPRHTAHYDGIDTDQRTRFLVAYHENKMVGCSTLQTDPRDGAMFRIRGMAVDFDFQNNTIDNQEETLVGQCICPDQSNGMLVSPDSDDDGTADGCLCENNNQNSELSSEVELDDIIIGVIALFSVILLLLFFRQYKDTSSRKKLRNDISEEIKINAAFESEEFAGGGWDEIEMRK